MYIWLLQVSYVDDIDGFTTNLYDADLHQVNRRDIASGKGFHNAADCTQAIPALMKSLDGISQVKFHQSAEDVGYVVVPIRIRLHNKRR